MKVLRAVAPLLALVFAGTFAGPASASLTGFQTYHGKVGYSSDGFGSTGQRGTISASVPVGSTVIAAYLYTSRFFDTSLTGGDGTMLGGTGVSFGAPVFNSVSCCDLSSRRADVTSIVKPVIDGGAGGVYNFDISEAAGSQDGESLVVIYSNPSLADSTFAILDGFASTTGDMATINFADPLHPADAGFFAEMFLGIGFSFDGAGCLGSGQSSRVDVNATTITESAGCNDDSIDGATNGNLITTGGFDDPYSPLLPSIADDHERYDLQPYITDGDTSIVITTFNASNDDNIFLAGFYVLGTASVVTGVPEPSPLPLLGVGVLAFGLLLLKRRRDRTARG